MVTRWLALTLLLTSPTLADELPTLVLRGLDPIELARGNEVLGSAERTASHLGSEYRFVSAENRTAFLADPDSHAIQLGGACARMGPLSGHGDSARWAVVDGRIYIFASDQCRDAFTKEPSRYLAVDEPRPEVDAASLAAGRTLAAKAVAAAGGAEAVAAADGLHLVLAREVAQGERTVSVGSETLLRLGDGSVRRRRWWGDWSEVLVHTAGDGFAVDDEGVRPLAASQLRELERQVAREPLALLRAAQDGDAVLRALGRGSIAGLEVERLELWHHGTTTILGLDPQSGALVATRFRGRHHGGLETVEQRWSEPRAVGALRLPSTVAVWVGDEQVEEPVTFATLELATASDQDFARPEG